ncbi:MAG: hypothetical protein N3G21_09695 [Candidatus Hydrogenedentes bacterium]|nr:hypothetical protein [Candidatus Hydrogenedentota bacterium]
MSMLASKAIEFFSVPSNERTLFLSQVYGGDSEKRLFLYIDALKMFINVFGNQPVIITRSPGRVNLRGMHTDTHGGFLNLMTLNREVIVIATPSNDGYLRIYNTNPIYQPLVISIRSFISALEKGDFPSLNGKVKSEEYGVKSSNVVGTQWHKYILGSFLQLYQELGSSEANGINAVVSGDIPEGCSLSSSHALCIAILLALEMANSIRIDTATKIRMVQRAEWFAGARSGLSDQVAELLCKRNHLLGVQIDPLTAEILEEEHIPIPEEVSVVVANSNQRRDISSTHSAQYVKNRFAYSVAIDLLKRAMLNYGFEEKEMDSFRTFRDFSLERIGGAQTLYEMFKELPYSLPIERIEPIIGTEKAKRLYETYFCHLPEESRPNEVNIRGAIVYGICENFRAHAFFEAMKNEDLVLAGYLMNLGHNGDRIIDSLGYQYNRAVTDDILFVYRDLRIDPFTLPGDYGASTPVLDRMVDIANDAGALGSSLTGAGLGGAIVALCLKESVANVMSALRNWLGSEEYMKLSQREKPLSNEEIENSVFENTTSQASGIVEIPELMTLC